MWLARQAVQIHGLDFIGRLATNTMYDLLLVALWIYSAAIQNDADVSDPAHLSLPPWYLERGCDEVWSSCVGACRVVEASFSLTIVTM